MIKHTVQRDIRKVLRIEKESATFYGLHNRCSFAKVSKKFKYVIVQPINQESLRVVGYGNDEEKSYEKLRQSPNYSLVVDGEFLI